MTTNIESQIVLVQKREIPWHVKADQILTGEFQRNLETIMGILGDCEEEKFLAGLLDRPNWPPRKVEARHQLQPVNPSLPT